MINAISILFCFTPLVPTGLDLDLERGQRQQTQTALPDRDIGSDLQRASETHELQERAILGSAIPASSLNEHPTPAAATGHATDASQSIRLSSSVINGTALSFAASRVSSHEVHEGTRALQPQILPECPIPAHLTLDTITDSMPPSLDTNIIVKTS